ncbi:MULTISPECIES: flagellar biosynthesis protein FlhF [unclassified Thiomonas]|uniref:flagellar biosynthesis protein FlhF n=1 Tax=unclassified Thiomonas TaxID=2625466 RepID=UPI0004DBAF10|nr:MULTISPECIES: flagellar biosynthesis protein FlhF [unclassified Thiomonas]CQR41827.1 putative Flagellar GTP-binding protein [Thiomonas sp. CB3]CDW95304.1 putative Flagellar GTP-binding protein [Thiomonas sp. CB2]VDY03690.1 putative Flagellar GTP-binding protein [Thiomonas sp. Bio17B3]VDY09134.1 putative Flagellar GTP-binding protein [Thiomonas sp. Sup16B3]VDY11939.1 putative Flagellar GTP-binding protein [Thiomonas sp. OC7]
MKIKRYTGTNTREVLTRIRNDLGADAVILSNREIVGGVELMAAVDFDASRFPSDEPGEGGAGAKAAVQTPPHPNPPHEWGGGTLRVASENKAVEIAKASPPRTELSSPTRGGGWEGEGSAPRKPADDLPLPAVARVDAPTVPPAAPRAAAQAAPITLEQKDAASLATAHTGAAADPAIPAHRSMRDPAAAMAPKDELGAMRHELQDLRQWMQSQMSGLADAGPLTPVGEQLQALGFSTARARQLGSQALNLRGALAAYLGKGLQVAADPVSAAGIYALVGPTGAGKTTTIAKLAARLVLHHGTAAVALITTDTYRIGGVEQLKIYGRILGVPVAVARDGEELQQHLRDFADRRYVLIDSIGLSPRDARMAEQMQWLQALGEGVTRLLVVGAGLAPSAYAELWSLYRRLPVAAAILTKLDESPSFGAALQWLVEGSVPLWFYTDGQRVPEDLHVPSLAKITALLEHDPVTRFDSAPAPLAAAAVGAITARTA